MMHAIKIRHTFSHLGTALCIPILVMLLCTPAPVIKKPEATDAERYAKFGSEDIGRETKRLLDLLNDQTTSQSPDTGVADSISIPKLSRVDITERLFEMTIHRLNPSLDYEKALVYAKYLFENKPDSKLFYANWGRVIKEHLSLEAERDSLLSTIGDMTQTVKALKSRNQDSRRLDTRIDSLQTVIKRQKQKIRKLGELDMMMERQRSKIQ